MLEREVRAGGRAHQGCWGFPQRHLVVPLQQPHPDKILQDDGQEEGLTGEEVRGCFARYMSHEYI